MEFLSAELLMSFEVKICPRVNSLQFFEAEREVKLDICCRIGIVSKFFVIVIAVVLLWYAQSQMPLHSCLLPILKPFEFFSRTDKKLHLHLLKFSHSEDKLTCNNLISECLSDLSNTKWDFHSSGLLNI